jgi:hypothetical protein
MVPADGTLRVEVRRRGKRTVVSWNRPTSAGVRIFYRVYRSPAQLPAPDPTLPPGRDGIRCLDVHATGAADCRLEMRLLGVTRGRVFVDRAAKWSSIYRVGLAANWRDDPTVGDVMLLSPAAG